MTKAPLFPILLVLGLIIVELAKAEDLHNKSPFSIVSQFHHDGATTKIPVSFVKAFLRRN